MIAKLFEEHECMWLLIDNVTTVERFTSRYKVCKSGKPSPQVLAEEVQNQNPSSEGWKGNSIYLARLLIKMAKGDIKKGILEERRTFKVVGLFINKPDGSEIYRRYGFTLGYLLNGEGKTIERL